MTRKDLNNSVPLKVALAGVTAAVIIGGYLFSVRANAANDIKQDVKIDRNCTQIGKMQLQHVVDQGELKSEVKVLKSNIKDMRAEQTIMGGDIKEILRRMPK